MYNSNTPHIFTHLYSCFISIAYTRYCNISIITYSKVPLVSQCIIITTLDLVLPPLTGSYYFTEVFTQREIEESHISLMNHFRRKRRRKKNNTQKIAVIFTCLDICLFVVHGWSAILLPTRPNIIIWHIP